MNTKDKKTAGEEIYDVRIIDFKLRNGDIDAKEYDAYLKKLPDDEKNAEYIDVYEELPPEEATPHAEELTFTSA